MIEEEFIRMVTTRLSLLEGKTEALLRMLQEVQEELERVSGKPLIVRERDPRA